MPLTKNEISDMILSAFPDATLELKDTMGDNNHFEAKIISKNFIYLIIFLLLSLAASYFYINQSLKPNTNTANILSSLLMAFVTFA